MVTAEAFASNRVPICATVLVGRARVELATNGLKVSTKQKVISKQRESMAAKSNIKSMS